ncbi:MAG: hypothetical protein QNJ73_17610 [Gammaproteobacteria bacterium]|nr:hypothetical protein [Gammaproteobacteria bacterium]
MSNPRAVAAVSQSGVSGGVTGELARGALADVRRRARGSETEISKSGTSTTHTGRDSAVLESRLVVKSLRGQEVEYHSRSPLDAAVGIKNGLIFGGVFWIVAYLFVSLINRFA